MPCSLQVSVGNEPGATLCANIRSFSSRLHRRRRSSPGMTSPNTSGVLRSTLLTPVSSSMKTAVQFKQPDSGSWKSPQGGYPLTLTNNLLRLVNLPRHRTPPSKNYIKDGALLRGQTSLAIELFGDLATILNLASSTGRMPGKSAALGAKKNPQEAGASEGLLSVVAGARFELTTFRL